MKCMSMKTSAVVQFTFKINITVSFILSGIIATWDNTCILRTLEIQDCSAGTYTCKSSSVAGQWTLFWGQPWWLNERTYWLLSSLSKVCVCRAVDCLLHVRVHLNFVYCPGNEKCTLYQVLILSMDYYGGIEVKF